jgi:geranylgeranyl reductase family protein
MTPTTGAWDAIVVGGGPGGSTVAWRLARGGARVLVIDAARFPRPKLCAGWVTPAVWRALEIDPARYPLTIQPFSDATIELDGEVLETSWDRIVSYGIIRREFDEHLLRRAEQSGAVIRDGVRVTGVVRGAGGVRVDTDGESFTAPIVVGAGGHHCPVARALGEIADGEAVVVTRESETRVGTDLLRELTKRCGTPELFAEPDFRGYGWYFTKGDFLNVGIGCLGDGKDLRTGGGSGRDLHRRFDAMMARLRADGRLPARLALEPFRGHAYAVRIDHPRRAAGDGFLLVGDAAGLARGVSGEGIGPAVESGVLAADAILEANGSAATRYAVAIAARFGSGRPGVAGRLLGGLPHAVTETLARTICRAPWLRRRLVFEGAFGME